MSEKGKIPVHRPYLGREELEAVGRVFDSRWLGLGSVTKEFEERLCDLLGVRHVIAVNTGTAALHTALDALDLQPGDEVLVPSLTFVSTVQAILAVAARPVFCEVCAETLTLNVADSMQRVSEDAGDPSGALWWAGLRDGRAGAGGPAILSRKMF